MKMTRPKTKRRNCYRGVARPAIAGAAEVSRPCDSHAAYEFESGFSQPQPVRTTSIRLQRISTVRATRRSGFTLVEMLLAIGILSVGVIAIASMFPVGLTQQRRSQDAIVGPTIAGNAYATLRAKLSPSDFGWFRDNNGVILREPINFLSTIRGDTTWRRPAFFLQGRTINDQFGNSRPISAGSIDLFRGTNSPLFDADTQTEIPYNALKWPNNPPQIILTQEERYWPQQSTDLVASGVVAPESTRYVWDCAFRRFQGRVQVAIFVYRVHKSGESRSYAVAPNPDIPADPPLPHVNLLNGSGPAPDDPWGDPNGDGYPATADENYVPGTLPAGTLGGNPVDFTDYDYGWQAPGQWILDQNNNIHRVLSGRRNSSDGPVELTRPVSETTPGWVYARGTNNEPVIALWYIPPIDSNGWQLTPVYVTVRDFE